MLLLTALLWPLVVLPSRAQQAAQMDIQVLVDRRQVINGESYGFDVEWNAQLSLTSKRAWHRIVMGGETTANPADTHVGRKAKNIG